MRILNTALIGFGYAGQTFHAPLITATLGLRLAAIVSGNPGKVRALWPDVPVLATPDAAFADPSVDLVVIATPNDTHADLARRALAAGKHVVVDKPFTVDLSDARDLLVLAQDANRLLSIFHNRRWDADFLALRSLIEDGVLGRITQFESHFDRFRPVMRDRWRERAGPGAGIWFDLAPHLIDQALCLFGIPQSIQADIASQRPGDGAPDYFHAVLRYAVAKRVILHGSMLTPDNSLRFAVHGDGGSFIKHGLDSQEDALKAGKTPGCVGWGIDPLPGRLTRIVDDRVEVTDYHGPPGEYRQYFTAIHTAITQGAANPVPPEQALRVMELIEAGVQSANLKREVAVS